MEFCILKMLFYLNILFPCTVFILLITGALHWRSSYNKPPQYSSNLLSIVILFNNALFWIVPALPLILYLFSFFFNRPRSQLFSNYWCDSQSYKSQLLLHSGMSSYLFYFFKILFIFTLFLFL